MTVDPWPSVGATAAPRQGAPRPTLTIAFVLYEHLTPLDLVGPLGVVAALARLRPDVVPVVVAERLAPVRCEDGLDRVPSHAFEQVPRPDVLVVPGGGEGTLRALRHAPLREYVREAGSTAGTVVSVCTGALVLASVGLLVGREATTHWAYRDVLERLGARYHQRRWVEDGRFLTTAGVTAGVDGGLRLVERIAGAETARDVRGWVDHAPVPPFGPLELDRLPFMARTMRAVMRARAPWIAAAVRRTERRSKAGRADG